MLFQGFRFKDTSLFYALSFSFVLFMSGCTDKAEEKTTTAHMSTNAAKIEVVANDNAREIKVEEKEIDTNQSKSYYYDYNTQSSNDAGNKQRTSMDANMHVRSPYEDVQVSMVVNKLSKEFMLKCSACHNDYANGVIGPSLLGKDADYIYNKIAEFKNGTKTNILMRDLIKMMSDEEIKVLADEIYTFNKMIKEMRK
ncbi:MAG: hypothetical protein WBK95_05635 [Sulfurimonas sp.]|nr:hypothetical protein [Sulfurimonas sp.]MDD3060707.1 hypothetical protein [Sulfurimonas sp.]MDD5202398.1 hypothetical protein [Sulfurimonas sp.]